MKCWSLLSLTFPGVDIELCKNKSAHLLMQKLLTAEERARIGSLDCTDAEGETLLRFSFKESVYKALHPFLLRPISFQEVEVDPSSDGSASLVFKLASSEKFAYSAEWIRFEDRFWITCVELEKC